LVSPIAAECLVMPNASIADHHHQEPGAESQRLPTSDFLANLLMSASADQVTIGWIIAQLGERSFGLFLLILAAIGVAPGLSAFVGVLLLIPAVQMILGRSYPTIPRFLAERQVPVAKLRSGIAKTTPLLRWLEKLIRPRWPTGIKTTKHIVGVIMLLLSISMIGPVPFSQVIPALTMMLMALAYLEEDGLVLAIATVIAIASLIITAITLWGAIIAGEAVIDAL
jgi:hypothetical protein